MSDITPEKGDSEPRARIVWVRKGAPRAEDPESIVKRLLRTPVIVHLFMDRPDKIFDPNNLGNYLESTLGANFKVHQHGDLIKHVQTTLSLRKDDISSALAKAKCSAYSNFSYLQTLSEEERIKLESEAIDFDPAVPYRELAQAQILEMQGGYPNVRRLVRNGYYEISELGNAYRTLLPQEFRGVQEDGRHVSLIITGRGIGNMEGRFGERLHMRGGFASGGIGVISTTGLVDAPGKPIEVERALRTDFPDEEILRRAVDKYGGINGSIIEEIVNEMFADRMLHYEDERLNEVVRGLSLSWILFGLGETGRISSCSTTDLMRGTPDLTKICRLHDGHWQEEVIKTQVKKPGDPEFCGYHQDIFGSLQSSTQLH